MARIEVVYKGHKFTAIADGAGLDVEADDLNTMGLATELWNAIYETRISLFSDYDNHDTTRHELITCLDTMKLI